VLGDTVRSRRSSEAPGEEREQRPPRVADERLRIGARLHNRSRTLSSRFNVAPSRRAISRQRRRLADIMRVLHALTTCARRSTSCRDADDPAPDSATLDLASLTQLPTCEGAGLEADANVQLNGHAIPSPVGRRAFHRQER